MVLAENYIQRIAEDIRSLVPESELPDENSRLLFRIYAVLALSKGTSVRDEDVHAAWAAWMTGIDPEHEALVEFGDLSYDQKKFDRPYTEAIRAVAEGRKQ